jgi:hypothetical protein
VFDKALIGSELWQGFGADPHPLQGPCGDPDGRGWAAATGSAARSKRKRLADGGLDSGASTTRGANPSLKERNPQFSVERHPRGAVGGSKTRKGDFSWS